MSEPMTFQKKSRRERYIVRDDVVEATGIEPVSKNQFSGISPGAEALKPSLYAPKASKLA